MSPIPNSLSKYQYAAYNKSGKELKSGGQEIDIADLLAIKGVCYIERLSNWNGKSEWYIFRSGKSQIVSDKQPLRAGDAV